MTRVLQTVLVAIALCCAGPAFAQGNGTGGGKGGGGKTGAGNGTCAEGLRLFDGERLVWARDSDAFKEAAKTTPLGAGHQPERPAIALLALVADRDDVRSIDVATCGGRSQEFHVATLRTQRRAVYVVANRRGAFKLVEIMADGREETLSRNVGRVTITPR